MTDKPDHWQVQFAPTQFRLLRLQARRERRSVARLIRLAVARYLEAADTATFEAFLQAVERRIAAGLSPSTAVALTSGETSNPYLLKELLDALSRQAVQCLGGQQSGLAGSLGQYLRDQDEDRGPDS